MRSLLSLVVFLALCGIARADNAPDARAITWQNCSGSIAVGGVAQTITLGHGLVRGFFLQNPSSSTESLFFDPSGTATTTTSPELIGAVGASVSFGPATIFAGNTISVLAATGGHSFTCLFGQ